MFSPTNGNSNINLKNILNSKKYNYDSDSTTTKEDGVTNKLRSTYNKSSTVDTKTANTKQKNRSESSDSASSTSSGKFTLFRFLLSS